MSQPDLDQDGGRKHSRVVVAMSGGVDSSVAAGLLVEQGHEVIGIMMRLWSEPSSGTGHNLNRCCTPDQMADARRVADHLDIPFYVIDVQQYFYDSVVRYFIDQHIAGRTPNPCIECNRQVRFSLLLDRALAMGADYLATGHYARIRHHRNSYQLLRAVDRNKDQSYVLHVLGQSELAQALFPVGDYAKEDVRQMAERLGLPVARKSESMDLCFLADGDHRRFLHEAAAEAFLPGPIIDQAGYAVGQHTGLANYTIGQRKGLGVALGYPVYVLAKNSLQNTLIVGDADQLSCLRLFVEQTNWVSGTPPEAPRPVQVMVRYRSRLAQGLVTATSQKTAEISLEEPVKGAAPGQGAVFFDGDICLGGGIICEEGYHEGY